MDSIEKMYSVKEVAHVLGWGPDTIRRLIRRRIIRAMIIPQVPGISKRTGRRKRIYDSTRVTESEVKRCIRFLTKD